MNLKNYKRDKMDIVLYIISGFLLLIGFVGCLIPILPGTPLSYLGILLLHFSSKINFSLEFLVSWGILVIVIQLLDYYIPIWGAKKFGGSRASILGSTVGMIVGLFFGPVGIIFGPVIGAFVGELLAGKSHHQAIRAAYGSFLGFIFGTISKLVVAGFLIYYYVEALISI